MADWCFKSELLDLPSSAAIPVIVEHNFGKVPEVISFYGVANADGALGFPGTPDEPKPYLKKTDDPNDIEVYIPEGYTFDGKFIIEVLS